MRSRLHSSLCTVSRRYRRPAMISSLTPNRDAPKPRTESPPVICLAALASTFWEGGDGEKGSACAVHPEKHHPYCDFSLHCRAHSKLLPKENKDILGLKTPRAFGRRSDVGQLGEFTAPGTPKLDLRGRENSERKERTTCTPVP